MRAVGAGDGGTLAGVVAVDEAAESACGLEDGGGSGRPHSYQISASFCSGS